MRYSVEIRELAVITVEVEANSEIEARRLVHDLQYWQIESLERTRQTVHVRPISDQTLIPFSVLPWLNSTNEEALC